MNQLQPYRQMLETASQSSTALIQLSQRTSLQQAKHPLWVFDTLLEIIAQDGFDAALTQSSVDSELYVALLKTRHQYDAENDLHQWVAGWRNRCFWDGHLAVVIAADAWLLQHSTPHLALLNQPRQSLDYSWCQPVPSGTLTTLSFCDVGLLSGDGQGVIRLYDAQNGCLLTKHQADGPVQMVCMVKPDLFVYSTAKLTTLWHGKLRWRATASTAAAFTNGIESVLLGDSRGRVLVFDVRSGELKRLAHVQGRVLQIAIWNEVSYIRTTLGELWELCLENGVCAELKSPLPAVGSMDLHGEEGLLVVASPTGQIAIWSSLNRAWSKPETVVTDGLEAIFWHGEYSVLGVTSHGHCVLWDRTSGQSTDLCVTRFPSAVSMAYCLQNNSLVMGHATHIYALQPHRREQPIIEATIQNLAVSEDGMILGYVLSDGRLCRLDIYAQTSFPLIHVPGQTLAVRPQLDTCAFSLRDGTRWMQTPSELMLEAPSEGWIRDAAYGVNGAWAHILLDGNIQLSFGEEVTLFNPPTPASQMAFMNESVKLVVGLAKGGVWLIDGTNGQSAMVNLGLGAAVELLVFSRDDLWLLVGSSDGTLGLWDCVSGRWCWRIRLPQKVSWAAFSSDASFLYVVGPQDVLVLSRHLGKVVGRHSQVDPITGMVSLTGDRICLAAGESLHFFQWRQPERRLC